MEQEHAKPSFPTLNYHHEKRSPVAAAAVNDSLVVIFGIGAYIDHQCPNEALKDILRSHDVSMTGNKETLIEKLSKLAATEYEKALPELDEYFSDNQFIRMASGSKFSNQFPILGEYHDLRNLMLSMYVAKHMHGNAIVTADHENDTFTVEELAHALITGKTAVNGTFLPVL